MNPLRKFATFQVDLLVNSKVRLIEMVIEWLRKDGIFAIKVPSTRETYGCSLDKRHTN
jgi:hypothetical protein